MREITISDYKRAYELGKKHAEECDLCGWYTPFLQASYDLGYEGIEVDFSKVVKAERYGDLPNGCSYNYADNKKEMGVSASNLVGEKEIGSSLWFTDREKIVFEGILLPIKGSDGEPLLLPLGVEQYDF